MYSAINCLVWIWRQTEILHIYQRNSCGKYKQRSISLFGNFLCIYRIQSYFVFLLTKTLRFRRAFFCENILAFCRNKFFVFLDKSCLYLGFHKIGRHTSIGIEAETYFHLAYFLIKTLDKYLRILLVNYKIIRIGFVDSNIDYFFYIKRDIYIELDF